MEPYSKTFSVEDLPDLLDKVVIVTGGATGIGKETSLQLLYHHAKVYIASRSRKKFNELANEVSDLLKTQDRLDLLQRLQFLQLDLSDVKSCALAAKQFLTIEKRLDILIANAALSVMPCTLSKDGIEIQFATNVPPKHIFTPFAWLNLLVIASRSLCVYLSPSRTLSSYETQFSRPCITNAWLQGIIKQTSIQFGQARIVVVASHAHYMYKPSLPEVIEFENLKLEGVKELNSLGDVQASLQRYARSKLANILFTRFLDSHLKELGYPNIFVNCLNPGTVGTAPSTDSAALPPWISFITSSIVRLTSIAPISGALTVLLLATDPDIASLRLSGRYFDVGPIAGKFWYGYSWDATESKLSEAAKNQALAERLWNWSVTTISSIEESKF